MFIEAKPNDRPVIVKVVCYQFEQELNSDGKVSWGEQSTINEVLKVCHGFDFMVREEDEDLETAELTVERIELIR